jgi:hypothetical protein
MILAEVEWCMQVLSRRNPKLLYQNTRSKTNRTESVEPFFASCIRGDIIYVNKESAARQSNAYQCTREPTYF